MDTEAERRWLMILIQLERDRMVLVGPIPPLQHAIQTKVDLPPARMWRGD